MTSKINWEAAESVADKLGVHTRELVAGKRDEEAREWALKLARETNAGSFTSPRVASYVELAVLLGHSAPSPPKTTTDDERLAWIKAELTSLEEKTKTLRDAVARIVAEHDQAQAAAAENAAEVGDAA